MPDNFSSKAWDSLVHFPVFKARHRVSVRPPQILPLPSPGTVGQGPRAGGRSRV